MIGQESGRITRVQRKQRDDVKVICNKRNHNITPLLCFEISMRNFLVPQGFSGDIIISRLIENVVVFLGFSGEGLQLLLPLSIEIFEGLVNGPRHLSLWGVDALFFPLDLFDIPEEFED